MFGWGDGFSKIKLMWIYFLDSPPPGQKHFHLFWSPSTMGANHNKETHLCIIDYHRRFEDYELYIYWNNRNFAPLFMNTNNIEKGERGV